jgi:hypothetical protein
MEYILVFEGKKIAEGTSPVDLKEGDLVPTGIRHYIITDIVPQEDAPTMLFVETEA